MKLTDILPSKIGFGTAPLGNMFRHIPEDEAQTLPSHAEAKIADLA